MEEVEKVIDLLKRLASDDEFREAFEQDPAAMLREYGVEIEEGARAALPPKDVLAEALTDLARQTIGGPSAAIWSPPWGGPWGPPWGGPWGPPWGGPWRPPWGGPWGPPWGGPWFTSQGDFEQR